MATSRRTSRSLLRRSNPVRDLVTERQRALDTGRLRERDLRGSDDLPALINEQVGEHMRKLEHTLVENFRQLGQRVVEESTTALNNQLGERIDALEQVSKIQTQTITGLRDSSRAAHSRVGHAVDEIERALAGAVPGFKLAPPAPAQAHGQAATPVRADSSPVHDQFRLATRTPAARPDLRDANETTGIPRLLPRLHLDRCAARST